MSNSTKHSRIQKVASSVASDQLGWLWARVMAARQRRAIQKNSTSQGRQGPPVLMEFLEVRTLMSSTPTSVAPSSIEPLAATFAPAAAFSDNTFVSTTTPSITRGQNVSFNATVVGNPSSPLPVGSVTFTDNGNTFTLFPVAPGSGVATASATLTTPSVGTHTIFATYSGDSNFPSSAGSTTVVVNKASTFLNLNINPTTANPGTPITLTAAISSSDTLFGEQPTGPITFNDGTFFLGTASIVSGTATFTAFNLVAGTHFINATYFGDGNNSNASSTSQSVVINSAATSGSLTIDNNPANFGQGVNLTASIVNTSGPVSPQGAVTFFDGTTSLGTANLSPGFSGNIGTANLFDSTFSVGTHLITASYSGNPSFSPVTTSATSLVINSAGSHINTSTFLNAYPSPVLANQSFQVSGSVTVNGGTGGPSGSVTLLDGTATLATGQLNSFPNGSFSLFANGLTAGTHSLTVVYSGDGNYATSTSSAFNQVVLAAGSHIATATSLSALPNPATFGQFVNITASVSIPGGVGSPSGVVAFTSGTTTLATSGIFTNFDTAGHPLSTIANFTTQTLLPGTYNITAAYTGDGTYASSSSTSYVLTVNSAVASTTVTTLGAFPFTAAPGLVVSLNAAVVTQSTVATGTVTFEDGTTTLGTIPLDPTGHAAYSSNTLPNGSHHFTAFYSGNPSFSPSNSPSITTVVGKASTSLTLSSNAIGGVPVGQNVTFWASLSVDAFNINPTGTFTFFDGTTSLGTASASFNGIQFNTVALSTGSHSIMARYSGDASTLPSQTLVPLSVVVNPVGTTTTSTSITVSPLNANIGTPISVVATVTSGGGSNFTGQVNFFDSGTFFGSSPVDPSGHATFQGSASTLGTHSITATYIGDPTFASSTSTPVLATVTASTSIYLNLHSTNYSFGQTIAIQANVSASSGPNGTSGPQGMVVFFDGTTSLGTASVDQNGQANLLFSTLSVGSHSLSAYFVGINGFTNSLSSSNSILVNPVGTATSNINFVISPNPAFDNQTVTLSVTVTGGSGIPTGTVTFYKDANNGAVVNLTSGVALFTVPQLQVGTYPIFAIYNGDATYAINSATPVNVTVNLAPTNTTVNAQPVSVRLYDNVTLYATVSVPGGLGSLTSPPSGFVTFFDGSTSLGTANVNGMIATFITSALNKATHSITGVYSGDPLFATSTSPVDSVIVKRANTTVAVNSIPFNPTFGQSVTLSAHLFTTIGTPSGLVTFLNGTSTIGTGSIDSFGNATFGAGILSAGSYSITASYAGDTNYNTSVSAPVILAVSPATPQVNLTFNPVSPIIGNTITFFASVTSATGNPSGSVTFLDGSITLGSGSVVSGLATYSTSTLGLGSHAIAAVYSGDPSFTTVTSPISNLTIGNLPSPSIFLSFLPGSVNIGQTVTITASLSGTSGAPTGAVTFFDGTTSLGTGSLVLGIATYSTSTFSAGTHAIHASYGGNSSYLPTSSSTSNLTVTNLATPSLSLTNAPTSAALGQNMTFTVSVTGSSGTPTGLVAFIEGTTTLGTAGLVGGIGTYSTSSLAIGTHNIFAAYSGNTAYIGAISIASHATVTKATALVNVFSTPASPTFGQTVTLKASVTGSAGIATGVVAFLDGTTTLGSGSILSGLATFTTAILTAGSHSISATYFGDTNYLSNVSSLSTLNISRATSSATIAFAPASPTLGQSVTLSSSVTSGAGSPSGTVYFLDGTTTLGTGSISSGVATFTTTSLSIGSHSITASYAGDTNHSPVTSSASILTIGKATSSTTIAFTPTSPSLGQTVTLSSSVASGAGSPTGVVAFLDGTTTLGSGTITSGVATFATSSLAAGTHSLTASYAGNSSFNASVSAASPLSVTAVNVPTTTVLSVGPQSASAGSTVTFSVTVSSTSGRPAGTVNFTNGSIILGTATLVNGVGTFSSSTLAVGRSTITAVYNPASGSGFTTSSSTGQDLLVGTNHQRYVAQLYIDLLNRTVDTGGLNAWTKLLDSGQTYLQIATAITSSREYDGIIVDQLYVSYLGRHSDAGGLTAWVNQMQSGLNAEVIRAGILGSQEYYDLTGPNHKNGTDTTFITALYQAFLSRAPDSGGLSAWLKFLNGDPTKRQAVASGISNSDENRTAIITALFAHYLHRTPDASGLASWKQVLANGTPQPIIVSAFVTSTEYLSRYEIV